MNYRQKLGYTLLGAALTPQVITPDTTPVGTALLEQENGFLRDRIAELEVDKRNAQERTERIIERQTLTLPAPEQEHRGLFTRVAQWWTAK